jgi:hypothetical protein
MAIYSKAALTIIYEISVICGAYAHKYNCIGGIFRKITIRPLGAQTRNADFVKICFISRTNFIFVRYSLNGGHAVA